MQFTPSQIPSDNLYKFIAISGLTISVVIFLNFDQNYFWLYIILSLVFSVIGVSGFVLWYFRLQIFQDQMLEKVLEKEGLEIEKLKEEERMRKATAVELEKRKTL